MPDYQVDVWDRYNWDEGKGVPSGRSTYPTAKCGQQHKVGLAQEFDMAAGTCPVQHHELASGATMPVPDDPGRHARDGGGEVDR